MHNDVKLLSHLVDCSSPLIRRTNWVGEFVYVCACGGLSFRMICGSKIRVVEERVRAQNWLVFDKMGEMDKRTIS
jgi:hypothetical protein